MWETLQKRRTLIIVTLFLLSGFALTILERNETPATLGPLSSVSLQLTGLSQAGLASAGGGVGSFWDRHIDLVGVAEENETLRSELNRLREERARLLGIMQENARLRAMVGFVETHPHLDLVPARVVARDVNEFFRVLSLRIDASEGRVQPNQPVVSSAGVVGQVLSVDGATAQVQLAVDERSSIDVVVLRNRARGVLEGIGNDNDYNSRVQYLLRRDEVRVGDEVVTSGMGGRFPADLIVGRIAEVRERNYGMYQEVRVEPAVDFSRLEEVYVIVGQREP